MYNPLAPYRKVVSDTANLEKVYIESFKTSTAETKAKISLENIVKVYDNGVKAIDNLNLTIEPGEFVVLLGPSGCGKTTALRMIAGLESISDGLLKFNDVIYNSVVPKNRNIAMVFQNYALYPFMSVYKNIAFGLQNKARNNPTYRDIQLDLKRAKNSNYDEIQKNKAIIALAKKNDDLINSLLAAKRELKIAKINKDEKAIGEFSKIIEETNAKLKLHKHSPEMAEKISVLKSKNAELKKTATKNIEQAKKIAKQREDLVSLWHQSISMKIEQVSSLLGINMYLKRKPAELSGGQRQRVALARAISKRTNLFLYDEPLSNLDAKLRAKMRTEIREIHDKLGATSIYVTHDQIEAMSMADKIVVMHKGYIQQVGKPSELINSPSNLFVAKFIGNTDVNILPATYLGNAKFAVNKTTLTISNKPTLTGSIEKNQKVLLGIRPEHIITEPFVVQNSKENKFVGKVIRKELLGNEVLVQLEVDGLPGQLSVVMIENGIIKNGDSVEFVININKINVFEPENGYNLLKEFDAANIKARQVWIEGEKERVKNQVLMFNQKNKLKFKEYLFHLMFSLILKSSKEKIAIHKSKPIVQSEKVAG